MEERKLTGKLKIFKFNLRKILCFCLAILCCLPFFAHSNNLLKTNAVNENEFVNVSEIKINSSLNCNKEKNKSLIKKGTSDFVSEYTYSPKQDANENNQTMIFSTDIVEFNDNQSLFLWVFIPNIIVQDLTIIVSDNGFNSMTWNFSGLRITASNDSLSLISLIESYHGSVKRGWKLLELAKEDAIVEGSSTFEIKTLSIKVGYNDELETKDDSEFAMTYPFLANKLKNKTNITTHQGYVVYAEKQSFLDAKESLYVDDKIEINSIKDLFSYVVIGKQNILENQSGYVWNILLTKPSGATQTISLDRKIDIIFEESGYYLIDVNLTTSDQDFYSLVSENYNIYVEKFSFGYFQKNEYKIIKDTQNQIVFSLADNFSIEEDSDIVVEIADKNIFDATYYLENGKIYLNILAKNEGKSNLKISVSGMKLNETQNEIYQSEINIIVEEAKSPSYLAIWVVFWCLIFGLIVYLIILFVKSRRFGVK